MIPVIRVEIEPKIAPAPHFRLARAEDALVCFGEMTCG
jgi:hypothetical protein